MFKVQFGKTGQEVSHIGLGGGQYIYDTNAEKSRIVDVIQYAYGLGINYFDTAPVYGSEETFGIALQDFDRSSYFLASKVGRYQADSVYGAWNLSANAAEESIVKTLKNLRTDHVDLLQIHDFDYADARCVEKVVSETLPCLAKMKERGQIKYIGLASYQCEEMLEIIAKSSVKVDAVLSHSRMTLVNQSLVQFIPQFKERGVAVVNGSATSCGCLLSSGVPEWMMITDELKEACNKAVKQCQLSEYIIERLANHYSYTQGLSAGVDVFLTGASDRHLLDLNLKCYFNGISKYEKAMCDQIVEDVFNKLHPDHTDINKIARATIVKANSTSE